jgi:hypothetical protein
MSCVQTLPHRVEIFANKAGHVSITQHGDDRPMLIKLFGCHNDGPMVIKLRKEKVKAAIAQLQKCLEELEASGP